MAHEDETSGNLLWRVTRVVVPWVALVVVVTSIVSMVSDYRRATDATDTATGSVEATSAGSAATGEPYVLILSDGLNLRAEPSTSAAVVSVLSKDEQLVYVGEAAGWYQVRRADGAEGWVAAGGRYTQLVEP